MPSAYFDSYARDYSPYKEGRWCYEDGCLYRGLECLHRATGEDRWINHLTRLASAQVAEDGTLAGYDPGEYNIDNVQAGRALLYLDEVTGEERWMRGAERLINQLAAHPRTRSGVYWHKQRYPWQIWLDGLYMGAPFQIGFGQRTGDGALVEDALAQVAAALEATFVPATGLYAHAFDEAREQPWADPVSGQSPAHWARALGWLAMALVDIADLVGPDAFAPLHDRTERILAGIAKLRRPDGLWLQVIDRPDLPGNYGETSASAMFTYALQRARDLGLTTVSTAGWHARLVAEALRPGPGGVLRMEKICGVAGLGPFEGRYRDGSAEYYVSEPLIPDDVKGVGPLMMSHAQSLDAARFAPGEARSA